ncbi:MAG: hypothetical protein D4S02_10915 [Rhodocyclaceae bacterium]|nr:MAG: hypothetical protein D4S02_10915 [Rhodocyclaceae bacterium]
MTRIFLAATVALTGCASFLNTGDSDNLSCSPPNCVTPRQAYQMSNGSIDSLPVATAGMPMAAPAAPPAIAPPKGALGVARLAKAGAPTAIREPATIMRIKIFPWVDLNDDLHLGSTIYTEIQSRRWSFGKLAPRIPVAMRGNPLDSAAPEQREKPGDGPIKSAPAPAPSGDAGSLLPKGGAKGDL